MINRKDQVHNQITMTASDLKNYLENPLEDLDLVCKIIPIGENKMIETLDEFAGKIDESEDKLVVLEIVLEPSFLEDVELDFRNKEKQCEGTGHTEEWT